MASTPDATRIEGLISQAAGLASGTTSSVELVTDSLQRIDQSQPELNAFRVVRAEAALAEAAEADARIAAGESAPLLGVPVAIKDDTDMAGEETRFGCAGEFPVVDTDAAVVIKLREAGAIIVGKTNTPELGQWPITEGPAFGVSRNPWNTDHTSGGSSGGSAAAVAAGLVPAAIGSDGAGSVRIPASWNGLVGIKPQRGRISTGPHPEAFRGLTCYGPLARSVGDAALMLDAACGNVPGDLHTPPAPDRSFAEAATEVPKTSLRIALSFRIPFSGAPATLDPRVEQRVRDLAGSIAGLGHEVEERDPSYLGIGISFLPRAQGGVAEWVSELLPEGAELDHRTKEAARVGRLLGGPIAAASRKAEAMLHKRVGAIFDNHDVLVIPTTAKPPLPCGSIDGLSSWQTDKVIIGACPYAWAWNVLGWPGISVPAGTIDGLPVGAQLLGPANSEPLLISLAAQLEAERRWDLERPPGY